MSSSGAPRNAEALAKTRYGFWAVIIGFGALLLAIGIGVWQFTTAIAGMAGAFFGVNLGQQATNDAREDANHAHDAANQALLRAEAYALHLSPAEKDQAFQSVEHLRTGS